MSNRKEKEIEQLLLNGLSPKKVANRTGVSQEAVRKVSSLYDIPRRLKEIRKGSTADCVRLTTERLLSSLTDPLVFHRYTVNNESKVDGVVERDMEELVLDTLNTTTLKETTAALKALSDLTGERDSSDIQIRLSTETEELAR